MSVELNDIEIQSFPLAQSGDTVRIATIGDGSCLFHAIAKASYIPYRTGNREGYPITPKEIIRQMRDELANYIVKLNGVIKSWEGKDYIADDIVRELRGVGYLDIVPLNEMISDLLSKDIYVIDANKKEVCIIDAAELLYKNRESIVLLYLPNSKHYEIIGVRVNGVIHTLFKPDNPFILSLRQRINYKLIESNKQSLI